MQLQTAKRFMSDEDGTGEVGEVVDRQAFANDANKYPNALQVVSRHKPLVVAATKGRGQAPTMSSVVVANKERGQMPTKSPAINKLRVTEKGTTLTISSPANKFNSLLSTPSPPCVDSACAVPAPTAVGRNKWVVRPLALSRQSLPEPQHSSILNREDRWAITIKRKEELTSPLEEELSKISGDVRAKRNEKGIVAIVVNYDDEIESKRAKLKRGEAYEKSLEVKDKILGMGAPKGQFGGSVDRWDGSSRDVALRQTSTPKKPQSQYDAEYDRGKVKKIKKNKQWQIRNNKFQAESDLQNALKVCGEQVGSVDGLAR
ncbi:hypothetical protein BC938DRAFT_482971 [Jimgerdemannia flammicorona]|uniref:Uncharacterized protein n=1 Tax=Jimgerdemannia flammicorona TaxID=994334 RepID=A0A433QD22_9FUNG|nr:hypothetical protein BC938DRAFT_482971 [Jimgerdemannia flammicorona]